jgi:hypothetical protein
MSETIIPKNDARSLKPAPKKEDGAIALGHYPLPDNTFEHDLALSDRYQLFSAELLRLSLLGIAAIGFLITNFVLRTTSPSSLPVNPPRPLPEEFKAYVILSLVCLGISAACALLHRYFGADCVAFHLESLRQDLRKASGDDIKAEKERRGRDWRFKVSGKLLFASATFLWLGAVFLIVSFIVAI